MPRESYGDATPLFLRKELLGDVRRIENLAFEPYDFGAERL